jgi:hypothetical protein
MKRLPTSCPCCKKRLTKAHTHDLRVARELAYKTGRDDWQPDWKDILCEKCFTSQRSGSRHITERDLANMLDAKLRDE